jgi:transcriptional regulator with XRE-family HTH domain
VIELGQLLREARERRGASLAEAERATRIRARFLAALEEERFDLLPGHAYARAFLREYAEFLGLDGRLLVEEYDLRFQEEDALALPPPPPPRRGWRLRTVLALGLAAALAAGAVAAWRSGGGERKGGVSARRALAPSPPPARRPAPPPAPPARRPRPIRLELAASRGDCWLLVRRASRSGPELFQGVLRVGERRRFTGPLWIRLGAPWNVDARLNGRRVRLPLAQVGNLLVDRAGLREAPPGV